jgi:4-alpha-glucanotransferase
MEMGDIVRLDHFRGYQAYWQVTPEALSATDGVWRPGPGARLFRAAQAALGPLPVVAENLGVVQGPVEALRAEFGWPGMAVLTLAFGEDPRATASLPHNFGRRTAAFSSTHDTDTVHGWWSALGGDLEGRRQRRRAAEYLEAAEGRDVHWRAIRALTASVADLVIFPAQDVAGLGSDCRLNRPGTGSGNWTWRLRPGELTTAHAGRLAALAGLYGRLPAGRSLPPRASV